MHKIDPRMLEDVELTTLAHAVTFRSTVKDINDWLEIRRLLPFSGGEKFFLKTALRSEKGNAVVHFINVSTQGSPDSTRNRPRRFGMSFAIENAIVGCIKVEFSVKASASLVELELALLSVDSAILESAEMTSVLVLALSTFMDRMSSSVVQPFWAASTKALAKTPIRFTVTMPDAEYADILKETLVDLELAVDASRQDKRYQPTCRGVLEDTRAEADDANGSDNVRVPLGEDQRLALADTLKSLREAKGLTQSDVARLALGLDKSHAAVSRLERGLCEDVGLERLQALATFFGTNLAFLNKSSEMLMAA